MLFSQAVTTCSKRVILESKPHPVASDASDASLVVTFDAHRNFSDYKYICIIIRKVACYVICTCESVLFFGAGSSITSNVNES